jgi:hypothetical protein
MATGLRSVLTSPKLGLALKALVLSLLVWLLREKGFSPAPALLFVILFFFFYLKPPINTLRFLPSALLLFLLPFFLPSIELVPEATLGLIWGGLIFALLGIKNLVILDRQKLYFLIHLVLVLGLGALFFQGSLPQLLLFVAFFFLFREFYFVMAPLYPQRLTLMAALQSLLLLEIGWVTLFLATNVFISATLVALLAFLFEDTILYHLRGALSREIVLRNISLFILLGLLLLVLP